MGDLINFRDPALAEKLRAFACTPRVLAAATVDHVGGKSWRVTVRGGVEGLAPIERQYRLRSKTEDGAAQDGIRVFVEECGG